MKKIMFNDEFSLTQSVLDGIKKQTRRIINNSVRQSPFVPSGWETIHGYEVKPRYKVGEVIAIAQRYKDVLDFIPEGFRRKYELEFLTSGHVSKGWNNKMFVKAILMPHQIKITNIRIERLQDISEKDCLLEGIHKGKVGNENNWMDAYYTHKSSIEPHCKPREAFAALINKLNGKGTWDSNPQVCVYEFELIK